VSTGKVITIMSMGILLDWLTNLGYVAFWWNDVVMTWNFMLTFV
jgi:hypothetical protein